MNKALILSVILSILAVQAASASDSFDFYISQGSVNTIYSDAPTEISFQLHTSGYINNPNVQIRVYIDERQLQVNSLPFQSTGTKNWKIVPGFLSSGQHTLRIIIDTPNYYEETSESNNIFTFAFNLEERIGISPITNLRATHTTQSRIKWEWENPSQNFAYTIIYLDGVNVANTTNNYYLATNLQEDTEYTLTVYAKGANNLISNPVSNTARTLSEDEEDEECTHCTVRSNTLPDLNIEPSTPQPRVVYISSQPTENKKNTFPTLTLIIIMLVALIILVVIFILYIVNKNYC